MVKLIREEHPSAETVILGVRLCEITTEIQKQFQLTNHIPNLRNSFLN